MTTSSPNSKKKGAAIGVIIIIIGIIYQIISNVSFNLPEKKTAVCPDTDNTTLHGIVRVPPYQVVKKTIKGKEIHYKKGDLVKMINLGQAPYWVINKKPKVPSYEVKRKKFVSRKCRYNGTVSLKGGKEETMVEITVLR